MDLHLSQIATTYSCTPKILIAMTWSSRTGRNRQMRGYKVEKFPKIELNKYLGQSLINGHLFSYQSVDYFQFRKCQAFLHHNQVDKGPS
jgi:hypothetical protein